MTRLEPGLKRRLAWGIAASVTMLWLVATVVAGLVLREEIDEVFDSALQEVVQRVLPLAYTEIISREASDAVTETVAPVGEHGEYITYIVRDAKGRVLLRSHDADPKAFPASLGHGFQDGPSTRFYTESAIRETVFVTAAERPGHRRKAVLDSIMMLLWPLALLLPLALLTTWRLVDNAFRPVIALGAEIGTRGGGNLATVADQALPPEIRPVAVAVNALLDRLRRALESERSFTANSAHELRTPVAAALAQTQRLIAELRPGSPRDRALDIERALRRLARLSEKLLQLAKAEGGALLSPVPQDLRPILALVLADFPEKARLLPLEPATGEERPVISRLDVDAFAILARNLVENALKHGDPAQPVRAGFAAGGVFRVVNHGPVVPAEKLADLCRRFARGDSEADGAGLGLAIARSIAEGAGGRLDLLSPAGGQDDGFEARVQLPVDKS